MAHAMPRLRIIAEPKASYRERYICEGDRRRNRAQRFVHADENPDKLVYPTIEIPREWIDTLPLLFYIRVTLVTVPTERVPVTCVHPYPIHTEDSNVIKDPASNSLYFPVSADELISGRKSFQFTHQKLTHYQLKNYGSLRILNSDARREQDLEDPTDARRIIEIYQLAQSQLLFSIATFQNNTQEPVIYDVSSVYSWVMTGTTTATNDDDMSFRCSPRRGDCRGGDEILMVIPRIDKRRAFSVRFVHPSIDQRSTVNLEFVDAKTISFDTPPCPVILTRDNPTVSIPIVVTQGDTEIARVDFLYQSLDNCLVCNSNLMLTDTPSPIQ